MSLLRLRSLFIIIFKSYALQFYRVPPFPSPKTQNLQKRIHPYISPQDELPIQYNSPTQQYNNSVTVMNSVDSTQKATLYRSYCPIPTYPTAATITSMGQSMISADAKKDAGNVPVVKQGNIAYRYERVGNMFKLVEVKGNKNSDRSNRSNKSKSNNTDPKEQAVYEDGKLQKIQDAIQLLTNRIISLELQQAKLPGLQKKVQETLTICRSFETQGNYLSEKITNLNHEITEVKERLEEIEEQGGSYEKQFNDIFKLMREIKEETMRTAVYEPDKKYEEISENLKKMIHQEVEKIRNTLKSHDDFTNKSWQKVRHHSPQPFVKPQKSFKLKYRQTYEYQQSTYSLTETNYKIDREGRLLDQAGYLLLDHNNREIKLNQGHLRKLMDFGLLV